MLHIFWLALKIQEQTHQENVVNEAEMKKIEDKQVIVISKRNRRLPATIIKEYLNQTRQTLISSDTGEVRRLRSAGLNG